MVFPRSWNQATALRKTSAIISLGLVLLGFEGGEMGSGRRARCVGQKVLIKGRWWVFMATLVQAGANVWRLNLCWPLHGAGLRCRTLPNFLVFMWNCSASVMPHVDLANA